ncbi:DUF5949 family protein [Streptomyces sp. BE308]|uniref:DUF5949 family protein n=1 Tax=unclassified Streptomyces TaxID=2593676 RepID=UPI00093BB5D7|nr:MULTISPECIES: DUF5949 family protein [unclassified Streptomyces]MCX4680452.1 DUF5949 family protein [Streptomyces sp. NBC_01433]MEE1796098.1 DUF5949 family protein [Streptomyces sp. BE308]OKI47156.1 hypothetical protein A6A29_25995 [Streptomyces sp. TSRI0281]WRZ75901.1 DUF5949 family protein [Streptomyces sp. NBC_01237]
MTSPQTATGTFTQAQLGTQILIGWSGGHPDQEHDVAFLLTYSLGDGQDGPEVGEAALRTALTRAGLQVGGGVQDATETPGLQVKLLVQAGQAVLTMPHLKAQYTVPAEWLAAAESQGQVYGMFATRPWPEAVPGQPVSEEQLRAFAANEDVVRTSAHCLLPVRALA